MSESKAFLQSVKRQVLYVKTLEEELDQFRQEGGQLKSPSIGTAVQNSHKSDLAEAVERIEEYSQRVEKEILKMISLKMKAEQLVAHDPDRTRRAVMHRRYMMCQSWSEICEAMHYGRSNVFKMHSDSLKILDKYAGGKRLD